MPGSSGHATEFKTMSIVDMLESRGMVSNKSTKITSVFESTFAAKKAQKAAVKGSAAAPINISSSPEDSNDSGVNLEAKKNKRKRRTACGECKTCLMTADCGVCRACEFNRSQTKTKPEPQAAKKEKVNSPKKAGSPGKASSKPKKMSGERRRKCLARMCLQLKHGLDGPIGEDGSTEYCVKCGPDHEEEEEKEEEEDDGVIDMTEDDTIPAKQLICCDGCPRSYHVSCALPDEFLVTKDPPKYRFPPGDWFCAHCKVRRELEAAKAAKAAANKRAKAAKVAKQASKQVSKQASKQASKQTTLTGMASGAVMMQPKKIVTVPLPDMSDMLPLDYIKRR